ncbi:LAETG motif-containing sortase-dependent surface protein [Streptomyces gamaensis]|uniref:LAETG motif-containing sortase-dependent surface protein n=1 Tax=Streptomyces gamaensis TaxID=1763542 RepID=A0ABW0Z596_9ACTN
MARVHGLRDVIAGTEQRFSFRVENKSSEPLSVSLHLNLESHVAGNPSARTDRQLSLQWRGAETEDWKDVSPGFGKFTKVVGIAPNAQREIELQVRADAKIPTGVAHLMQYATWEAANGACGATEGGEGQFVDILPVGTDPNKVNPARPSDTKTEPTQSPAATPTPTNTADAKTPDSKSTPTGSASASASPSPAGAGSGSSNAPAANGSLSTTPVSGELASTGSSSALPALGAVGAAAVVAGAGTVFAVRRRKGDASA